MKRFENINLAESHCIAIDRFNRCDFLPSSLFCLLPSLFHLRPLINDPFQTLKQLCIVPKNPLISRFLSRVNFFKKPVWRKCVPRYLVYPILRLSLDGWLLWKKEKKRKEGSRIHRGKIIGRYIKEIWFVGWNYSVISSSPLFLSLSLSLHYFYSLLFVSIVFHWRGYMKRDNIRSGEIRDFSHRSFRGYSINNNNNNNNCIIDLHVCSCKKFKTNVRPANSSSVINFLLHALQFRTFFT